MPRDSVTGFGIPDPSRYQGDERAGAWALDNLPYDLMKQFNELAQYGKYGEGGVESITGSMRREGALNRRLKRKGMLQRSSTGRRLGPRAGAVDRQLSTEGLMSELAASQRGSVLQAENLGSRAQGLQGIAGIMQFLQQRYEARENRQGGGVLDWIGPLATIAATAFGGPAGGAASETAQKTFE